MGLSKEEKEQLEALTRKSKEPDGPPANVNFTLDLSSDSAWDRAKKLGLVREPEPGGSEEEEEEESGDDPPKRRGRGSGYFGTDK